jgi:uncharacterized membrane protein YukC
MNKDNYNFFRTISIGFLVASIGIVIAVLGVLFFKN